MTPAETRAINEANLLRWQMERERVKVATLQAENRRLRKMTRNGKLGRILHQAQVDAKQLCGWRFADFSVSRRACEGYGMRRRRWEWAVALLRVARVVDRQRADTWLDDAFAVVDLAEAQGMIDSVAEALRHDDDGLQRLRRAMPRWTAAGKPKGQHVGYALG